jgi:xenotropic and polytropic retrovirus receptor 1
MAEEVIAVLEKNGVKIIGAARSKPKKGLKPKMASMRIDIPPSTPSRTIAAVTSVVSSVWEDLINGSRKDGATGGSYINNKKIQCAEKMIRGAFVELYRGLGLIKKYRYFDNFAPNWYRLLVPGLPTCANWFSVFC